MVHTVIATACISAACAAFGGVLVVPAAASPGDAQFTSQAPLPSAPGPGIPDLDVPNFPNLDVPTIPNLDVPNIPGNI